MDRLPFVFCPALADPAGFEGVDPLGPPGFTDEQRDVWNRFCAAALRDEPKGHAVLGFQWVCELEGAEPPSEEQIRKALAQGRSTP